MVSIRLAGRRTLRFLVASASLLTGLVVASTLAAPSADAATVTLVPAGATWRYLDTGVAPPSAWRFPGFVDDSWKAGRAQLGYGDGDEATVVSYGGDASRKHITTWFRTQFTVADVTVLSDVQIGLRRDDGAVVYVNGVEVARSNMPTGAISATTVAVSASTSESTYFSFSVPRDVLTAGPNLIAVEVHQSDRYSSDISFDLRLTAVSSTGSGTTTTTTTATTIPTPGPTAPGGSALVTLVARGSTWRYKDDGSDQGTAWRATAFDDSSWAAGRAELGFGDGDEATLVAKGPTTNRRHRTTYFRQAFSVPSGTTLSSVAVALRRDDGAVVYVNGTEVARSAMPTGTITYQTLANAYTSETTFFTFAVPASLLVAGTNVVAVEVHQADDFSSDLSFDLGLTATTGSPTGPTTTTAATTTTRPATTTTRPPTTTTTRPPSGQGAVFYVAGDIAGCAWNTDEKVSDVLAPRLAADPDARFLAIGDLTYGFSDLDDFEDCYDPGFGRFKHQTRPLLGNHEYGYPYAQGFFDYWGSLAPPTKGYRSFRAGRWLVLELNSACGVVGCASGSAQYTWVQNQISANPGACIAAAWHIALFSSESGYSPDTRMRPILSLLRANGLDVLLTGHAHNYERFARLNASGQLDSGGFRPFVVGTGGVGLRGFSTPKTGSQARNSRDHGVLELRLHDTGYTWEFLPIAGGSFTDSGSDSC